MADPPSGFVRGAGTGTTADASAGAPPAGFVAGNVDPNSATARAQNPGTAHLLDFMAGLGQGALDPLEGAVQLGAWPFVGATTQDWLPGLRRRAESSGWGTAGEMAGSAAPFLLQPELGIGEAIGAAPKVGRFLRGLYNMAQRSTLPAVLQPKDPQHMGRDLGMQAGLGTLFGETLQGIGKIGGKLADRFTKQDTVDLLNARIGDRFTREKAKAESRQERADLERRITNEQMRKNYELMKTEALTKAAGSETARRGELETQAQIPQQMTDRVYQMITGLGRINMPRNMDLYRAPALTQREVGKQLDGIYAQMKLDTGSREMTMGLPAIYAETEQKLRGLPDPTLKETWNRVYNELVSHRFNQGVITGPELQNYLSTMRNTINAYGMAAQGGTIGARDIANGLRNMLYKIEDVADRFDENAAKLGQDRRRINMAYELSSRMVEASNGGRNPLPTPTQFLDAWKRADGERHFGLDKRWVEMKTWMQGLEKEHTREIPPAIPAVLPKQPTPFEPVKITQPKEPKPLLGPRDKPEPPGAAGEAVGGLAGMAAHGHGIYPGAAARVARTLTHTIPNMVPRPAAELAAKIPPYTPPATAAASNLMTRNRPLWIVRGPRGEDLGLANTNDPIYLRNKPPGSYYERTQ